MVNFEDLTPKDFINPTEDERLAFERRYRSAEVRRDEWPVWCPWCDTPLIRGVVAFNDCPHESMDECDCGGDGMMIVCKDCYEQLKVKVEA